MSELLYMQDFNIEECEAGIISISATEDGRTDIVLDQTCFYARGGGQDWDMGTITDGSTTFEVEEVRLDEHGDVRHIGNYQAGSFAVEAAQVACKVNHERRMINTRLHSAGHVIDMAVDKLGLDWVGTKGQHYPHLSAVEYSGTWEPERAEELRVAIEKQANDFIQQGIGNSLAFMPVEEMHRVVRHVPENIPKNKPGRVVMYGENFGIPCGGTHVKNLREVGAITIPKVKEKKGVIRVSYTVEGINQKQGKPLDTIMNTADSYIQKVKGKVVTFTHLGAKTVPFEQVTSVAVVPFTASGELVVVNLRHRGLITDRTDKER